MDSLYLFVPLLAAAGSAFAAGMVLSRDPGGRANRQMALLGLCAAFWALCEVIWNGVAERRLALGLVRFSALGWMWIGPVTLHLFLAAVDDPARRVRALLPFGYAASALLLLLAWTTPWVTRDVVRTSWGWAYQVGPLFPACYGLSVGGVSLGLWVGYRAFVRHASPSERTQGALALVAVVTPLLVASVTDVILPWSGVQPPRFGTLAISFLVLCAAWSSHRFGFSILAPGRFAPEILESLADGVVLTRPGGQIRTVNGALARLVGRDPARLPGTSLAALLPGLPLDPLAELEAADAELCTAAGGRLPVAVSSTLLRDKRGLPIGLVWVVHDQREVVALRHRVVTSGRLAAVGQLAAGIAHEINNPIAYVRANLGLLRGHWAKLVGELGHLARVPALREAVAEGEELIAECMEGIDRAAGIVRDVTGFSRAGAGERGPVDLNDLLDRVVRVAALQLAGRARIEKRYGEIPPVFGGASQLQQVFLNLLLNAGQAVEAGGRIRLVTGRRGRQVVVRVEDDGCGIPPEVQGRIFDPFFTTKPQGEGTGLGLAIAWEIVRKHGGEISLSSEPGRGTTFSVHLPAAEET